MRFALCSCEGYTYYGKRGVFLRGVDGVVFIVNAMYEPRDWKPIPTWPNVLAVESSCLARGLFFFCWCAEQLGGDFRFQLLNVRALDHMVCCVVEREKVIVLNSSQPVESSRVLVPYAGRKKTPPSGLCAAAVVTSWCTDNEVTTRLPYASRAVLRAFVSW